MTLLTHLPPSASVHAVWSLVSHGHDAAERFTLHRFSGTDPEGAAYPLSHRAQADTHLPPTVLRVQIAAGDHPSLVDAWVEVDPELRDLLLTDPSYAPYRTPS